MRKLVVSESVTLDGAMEDPGGAEGFGSQRSRLSSRLRPTGRLVEQLTNLSTGTSIVINASGPARVSDDGTTVTLLGETALLDAGGFIYPGSPPDTQLVSGMVVLDSTGVVSERGHTRDLCTELA